MQTFCGRLFGPGLAGAGQPADCRWLGELLTCTAGEAAWTLRVVDVQASGFNDARLRLDLEPADGEPAHFSLFVDDPAARSALIAAAPARWQPRLARAGQRGRRVDRRFRMLWVAVGVLALLPLLAAALLWQHSDRLVGWVVNRVPVEQEARLGELVLAQSRARWTLHDSGTAVQALRDIGDRLTVGSPFRYRWLLADAPEVNAFAAPGGVIVVFSGLIRQAESPEALAGVLAHEVAHVELRHSLRAAVKGLGLRAALSLVFGEGAGGALAGAAADLTELKFSRDAERAADLDGLRRLQAARIDPQGMLQFFARLDGKVGQGASVAGWLSSHPPAGERRALLAAQLAAANASGSSVPAPQPLVIDWPAVQRAAGKS